MVNFPLVYVQHQTRLSNLQNVILILFINYSNNQFPRIKRKRNLTFSASEILDQNTVTNLSAHISMTSLQKSTHTT